MKTPDCSFSVRPPRPDERDDVHVCVLTSYLKSHALSLVAGALRRRPDPDVVRLVAARSEVIVGAVEVSIHGNNARIEYLCTSPALRGRGVGRLLLDEVTDQLAGQRVTPLVAWTVRAEPGQAWLRRQGFSAKANRTLVRASAAEATRAGFLNPGMTLIDAHYYADIAQVTTAREWFHDVCIEDLMVRNHDD